MNKSLIFTKNLIKTYPINGAMIHALNDVNLEVTKKEFVAIVGPSGCGKSTLLSLMGGLMEPTSGQVFLEDQELSFLADKEKAALRRSHFGFVFQSFELLSEMTASENIEFPMVLAGIPKEKRLNRVDELLTQVGLSSKSDYLPDELSAGQKQRVAIARALANSPDIILADEPTGNLDSATAAEVMDLFSEIHQETDLTLIVVTHAPEDAARAERIVKMRDGKIVG